jgi:hypothetical protein
MPRGRGLQKGLTPMPLKTLLDNTLTNMEIDAESSAGFRTLTYDISHSGGSLGGGTLCVFTEPHPDMNPVRVPDAKLSAAKLDDNGDVVQQLTFQGAGTVWVQIAGASSAINVKVCVR